MSKPAVVFNQTDIIERINGNPKERANEIDKLYHNMVNKSSFTFGRLNAKTFQELYNELGDSFYFKGYILDHKLIGFATATIQNKTLNIVKRLVKDWYLSKLVPQKTLHTCRGKSVI